MLVFCPIQCPARNSALQTIELFKLHFSTRHLLSIDSKPLNSPLLCSAPIFSIFFVYTEIHLRQYPQRLIMILLLQLQLLQLNLTVSYHQQLYQLWFSLNLLQLQMYWLWYWYLSQYQCYLLYLCCLMVNLLNKKNHRILMILVQSISSP